MVSLVRYDPSPQPGGQWTVLGFTRAEAETGSLPNPARTIASLGDLASEDLDYVAVCNREIKSHLERYAYPLIEELPDSGDGAIVLLSLRPCPWPEAKSDGRVYSFLSKAETFRKLRLLAPNAQPWQLCFRLLYAAMNGIMPLETLLIRQLPYPETRHSDAAPPVSAIMAHRGNPRHLHAALFYLDRLNNGRAVEAHVGLDVDDTAEYRPLIAEYSRASFFHVQPAPAGPYFVRQELAQRSSPGLLMLHDSDDVSCSDRLSTLYGEMCASGSDLVGSHELRVDETTGEIFAIRFPLDVIAALHERPGHALLHGTGLIRRNRFFDVGGLSTDQILANDTQFLFRAFFHLKIRNVNAFLYVRRRHQDALTVAPKTANGIPLRLQLDFQWRTDFQKIKRGELTLEESSLRQMRGATEHRLIAL